MQVREQSDGTLDVAGVDLIAASVDLAATVISFARASGTFSMLPADTHGIGRAVVYSTELKHRLKSLNASPISEASATCSGYFLRQNAVLLTPFKAPFPSQERRPQRIDIAA